MPCIGSTIATVPIIRSFALTRMKRSIWITTTAIVPRSIFPVEQNVRIFVIRSIQEIRHRVLKVDLLPIAIVDPASRFVEIHPVVDMPCWLQREMWHRWCCSQCRVCWWLLWRLPWQWHKRIVPDGCDVDAGTHVSCAWLSNMVLLFVFLSVLQLWRIFPPKMREKKGGNQKYSNFTGLSKHRMKIIGLSNEHQTQNSCVLRWVTDHQFDLSFVNKYRYYV